LTVTVTALDVVIWEGEPLSLTCNSKDHIPDVDKGPVETVGLSPAIHAKELPKLPKLESSGPFLSHWQLLGLVPPVKEVVVDRIEFCPAPIVGGLADTTGGVGAGFAIMLIELDVTITDGDPASVT